MIDISGKKFTIDTEDILFIHSFKTRNIKKIKIKNRSVSCAAFRITMLIFKVVCLALKKLNESSLNQIKLDMKNLDQRTYLKIKFSQIYHVCMSKTTIHMLS